MRIIFSEFANEVKQSSLWTAFGSFASSQIRIGWVTGHHPESLKWKGSLAWEIASLRSQRHVYIFMTEEIGGAF
jgi:hypothetical protein